MLGKLFKYEFSKTGKTIPIFFVSILIMCIIGCISIFKSTAFSLGLGAGILTISIIAIMVIMVTAYLSTAINFYKSIYTNEGYLTLTLPVKVRDIVFVKAAVSTFWIILSHLLLVLLFFVMLFFIESSISVYSIDMIIQGFEDIQVQLKTISPISIILNSLNTIISTIYFIGAVYFAISLGNTTKFNKHPVASTLIIYILIQCLVLIVTDIFESIIPIYINFTDGHFFSLALHSYEVETIGYHGTSLASIIISIGMIFVFFLGNNYIMKRKLCLK